MKKLILIIVFLFMGFAKADVMPINVTPQNSLGLYQITSDTVIYTEPDQNSKTLKCDYNNLYVYIPSKSLAMAEVTDDTEDWVQVIYDRKNQTTGWIKKDDLYKFSSWINFYNMYGKKYGLYILKNAPHEVRDIYSAGEDSSQIIGTINMPIKIKLNVIRGNWALVSVLDMDRIPKTGYIRWRSTDGERYLFPDIK